MNLDEFDHVVLLAHGSTDPMWKLPFERLHKIMLKESGAKNCSLAYMELCEPSFENVILGLADSVKNVAVLPLFFATGRHLRFDVPKQIAELTTDDRVIHLLPPIGDDERIQLAMIDIVKSHLGK